MAVQTKEECPICGKEFRHLGKHLHMSNCGTEVKVAEEAHKKAHPEAVQAGRLRPGTIYQPRPDMPPIKVRWTRRDVEELYPKVMIINPPESCPVIFNRVAYYIHAGVDQEVPACIADLYNNYLRSKGLPRIRPVGNTIEERANQVTSQGTGLLEPIPDEV